MRELLTIALPAGQQTTVQCPIGKRVRVVAVQFGITPLTDGDIAILRYQRGTTPLINAVSEPLGVNYVAINGAVGVNNTRPMEAAVDPVTGAVTWLTAASEAMFALPDIWWPWDVQVQPVMEGGTAATGTLTYELQDERKDYVAPAARQRRR